jgi:hypothetical protein
VRFHGAFTCEGCGKEFTIDLGPQKLGELKTPKKIGTFIGELSVLFARSCKGCEEGHQEDEPHG